MSDHDKKELTYLVEEVVKELRTLNEILESIEIMKRCEYFCDRFPTENHDPSCSFYSQYLSN